MARKATANHPDPVIYEDEHLAEFKDAIERLFEEHRESVEEPDPEAIAVELFWWDYLDYIPEEDQIEEVLKMS